MERKKLGRPLKADAKRASINVRMKPDLHAAIVKAAEKQGVTPSEWVRQVAAEKLST